MKCVLIARHDGFATTVVTAATDGTVLRNKVVPTLGGLGADPFEAVKSAMAEAVTEAREGRHIILTGCAVFETLYAGSLEAIREPMLKAFDFETTVHTAVECAHAKLFRGKDGIAVYSNLGAASLGKNRDKKIEVIGGGYLVEKGGNLVSLVWKAADAGLRGLDGRGQKTILSEMLSFRLGCKLVDALPMLYKGGVEFALSLAPVLFDAFDLDDDVAVVLVTECAICLSELVMTAFRKVGVTPTVGFSGPLFVYLDRIFPILRNYTCRFEAETKPYPEITGAFVLAMRAAGFNIQTVTIERFSQNVTA